MEKLKENKFNRTKKEFYVVCAKFQYDFEKKDNVYRWGYLGRDNDFGSFSTDLYCWREFDRCIKFDTVEEALKCWKDVKGDFKYSSQDTDLSTLAIRKVMIKFETVKPLSGFTE